MEDQSPSLWTCPICSARLSRDPGSYICPNGHRYDRAREGYVHLLPANRKYAKNPGDDQEMVRARNRFLARGYYASLRQALCQLALEYAKANIILLDSGCGEGYYTAGLWESLTKAGFHPHLAGVDLSKASVRLAAKQVPQGEFAVASVYHLPLGEGTVDLLLNCFSPLALEEFYRVLRPGGVFLYVVPAARHLWELKQVLYEHPYLNREEETPYPGFTYQKIIPVEQMLNVTREDLADLFRMTPYYWKTPKAGAERLAGLEGLRVQASFRIHIFRRD